MSDYHVLFAEWENVVWSAARMNRVLRAVRLWRYFNRISRELNCWGLLIAFYKVGLGCTTVVHACTCMWYSVACPLGKCRENSWLTALDESS